MMTPLFYLDVALAVSCHPERNLLASGALEKDLTVKIWESPS